MQTKTLNTKDWDVLPKGRFTAKDRAVQELVTALSDGKAVEITPETNESPRGLKVLISRRAGQAGFKVEYRETAKGFAAKRAGR